MLLPRAVDPEPVPLGAGHGRGDLGRRPAQARIRSGLAVPITGAIPAGCLISQPSRIASPVVPFSAASAATSAAVASSAGVGAAAGAPV